MPCSALLCFLFCFSDFLSLALGVGDISLHCMTISLLHSRERRWPSPQSSILTCLQTHPQPMPLADPSQHHKLMQKSTDHQQPLYRTRRSLWGLCNLSHCFRSCLAKSHNRPDHWVSWRPVTLGASFILLFSLLFWYWLLIS
jgi:hypothetical protein